MTAVSDRLDRLERSRSNRSDCESADLQSSMPLPPSALYSRSRQWRGKTKSPLHASRKCGPLLDEILRITAGAVRESFKKVGQGPS